jgi:flagellar protein FliS
VGYTNAYTAYKETGVKTASQGKLIVLLYQEAVKQLGKALTYFGTDDQIEPGDIEKLNNCIVKTQEILTELMISLDMDKGGEIAKNLMALYVFFNKELLDANIKRDRQKIESVHRMMDELTNAWVTAVESTAPVAQPVARTNIDING